MRSTTNTGLQEVQRPEPNRRDRRRDGQAGWRTGIILLLLLSFMLGSGGQAYAGANGALATGAVATGASAITRSGGATLHEGPAGPQMQTLAMGEALTASGRTEDGAWVLVSTRAGDTGWVRTDRLVIFGVTFLPVASNWAEAEGVATPTKPTTSTPNAQPEPNAPADTAQTTGAVTATRLNVRAGPGTGYGIVAQVASGDTITALARDANAVWVQIELPSLPGQLGWVSGQYLSLDGDVEALPVSKTVNEKTGQLPASPPAPSITASPTGLSGRLVFQESSGDAIYIYDLASGAVRMLARGADPAISPDSGTVVFWRDEEGQHALYLTDIDGANQRRILLRGEKIRGPAWSPDGGSIVLGRVVGQGKCRDAGYGFCLPDVFPYNQTLPLKEFDKWGLTIIDTNGSGFRDLSATSNAFSPDWGDRGIVYDSGAGIQITTPDAGEAENSQLVTDQRAQDPAWQPGGPRIVYQSLEKDHWEIFVANSDGSNPAALTRPATTLVETLPHNVAPTWSPDGQSVVFLSNRDSKNNGGGPWSLWVMDANGGNQRRLPVDVSIKYRYQGEQVVSWGK